MNLRQLDTFKAVAETGSIRAAARLLCLTQPAVTHTVRELEQSVGALLLRRSVKGVELTDLGTALLKRAHLVLNEVRRTQEEIIQLRDGVGGSLCIAFSSIAAMRVLTPALKAFRAMRPQVALELHEVTLPAVQDQWQNGKYDFAVLSELAEHEEDSFERSVLFSTPLVVAARARHPQVKATSILELRNAFWLVPGYGQKVLNQIFGVKNMAPPDDVIFCQSSSFALDIMRQSDAVGIFSSLIFQDPFMSRGLVALDLVDKLPKARVSIVVRNSASLTPAGKVFIQCLKNAVPKLD